MLRAAQRGFKAGPDYINMLMLDPDSLTLALVKIPKSKY